MCKNSKILINDLKRLRFRVAESKLTKSMRNYSFICIRNENIDYKLYGMKLSRADILITVYGNCRSYFQFLDIIY